MANTAEPVMQFRSHVAGSSVQVHIYPDRIEWRRTGYKPAGGMTAAVLTAGLSLALPGRKDSNYGPARPGHAFTRAPYRPGRHARQSTSGSAPVRTL